MGRKRKFQFGDVVLDGIHMAVIVDWERRHGKGEYRVVRVLHPVNGAMYGPALWRLPQLLVPTDYPNRFRSTVKIYKANEKLEERGCACNCCAHTAIPVLVIRSDGTFRWEVADDG